MFKILKTAALSALIGLGAVAAMPAAAQADGLYLNFGGHGPSVGLYLGDRDHSYDRRHYRPARDCTPNRALNKAERLGLRRAHIRDVSRRTIKVSGRMHGERVNITFARAPHCPIIRW
jgi:hypothetical protein